MVRMCTLYRQIIVLKDIRLDRLNWGSSKRRASNSRKSFRNYKAVWNQTVPSSCQFFVSQQENCQKNWAESSFKIMLSRSRGLGKEYWNVTVLPVYYYLLLPLRSSAVFHYFIYSFILWYLFSKLESLCLLCLFSFKIHFILVSLLYTLALLYPPRYRIMRTAWRRTAKRMWCMEFIRCINSLA